MNGVIQMLPWLAAIACGAWVFLLWGHGRFWLADQRIHEHGHNLDLEEWPGVIALVPARNEAAHLPATLRGLLDQEYPGLFRILLIDDESEDGSAECAAKVAREHPRGHHLEVVSTRERPEGWVGKMWALQNGLEFAQSRDLPWRYAFLSDADISHPPLNLRSLVGHAQSEDRALVSLMVKLESEGAWERWLIPAFVYFFQQLYPFPRVNQPGTRTAAAAGGCVLVRRDILERIGGFAAIRGEVIDDCALAARVKREAPIWLGLSETARSIRPYGGLSGVWEMVARSAFTQLRHSWALLLLTVIAMFWLYLVPPLLVLSAPWHRDTAALALGIGAWALQALSFAPTLALYGRHPIWGFSLPLAGALYTAMTVDSALRHRRGQGAVWKNRAQAGRAEQTS